MSDAKDLIDQILNRRPRGPRPVPPRGGDGPKGNMPQITP